MIDIIDKEKCCGCGSCVQKCPKSCIKMITDAEGFWYPVADHEICIECGLCEKICPCINNTEEREPNGTYAAISNDEDIRGQSSSGGIFSLLALGVLKEGGIVVGAAFRDDWQVKMLCVSDEKELWRLRGSKYVQADTALTYSEVESYLKKGRTVLYSGTPCQIKALKLFLRKEYHNLYTVDVACHGVPSPGIWGKYIYEISKTAQRAVDGGSTEFHSLNLISSIKEIKFREKKYGWRKYRIVFSIADPTGEGNSSTELSSVHYENPYFNAFNYSLIIRSSCTKCPAKHGKSNSDITIADFWGIENVAPDFDDNKGTSLVLVNTGKGQLLFEGCNLKSKKCTYGDALKYNAGLRENTVFHPKRETFFKNYQYKNSTLKYMQSLLTVSFGQRAIGFIKRKLHL